MTTYKIKFPQSAKNLVSTVAIFLGDGGFITDTQKWVGNGKSDIEFTIECNNDTEFADLLIEVGRHLGKHNLMS